MMKILRTVLLLTAFLAIASHSFALDCMVYPVDGTYSTYVGTLLPGRATEAFCNTPFHGGVTGNTQVAESWNYVALGTQWKVWGMQIDENGAMPNGSDVDEYGDGWVAYRTYYDGGQFWFSKDHTWGDGVTDLTGVLNDYIVDATLYLEGGVVTEVYSTVHFTGLFDDCPNVMLDYVISNAARIWTGDAGDLPADYPALACSAPGGEAFTVCCATAKIIRTIGTEDSSWGAIKQLHK